jgi:glycine cleavage system pyridoxal-binding protein P
MRYLSHTCEDVEEMLRTVGASTLDDLFFGIPGDTAGHLRIPDPGDPPVLGMEVANASMYDGASAFLGGGCDL